MHTYLKAVLLLCAFFVPRLAGAQMPADPVTWTADATKGSGKIYQIRISSVLKTGWHIYAIEAGGDGTLIPTTFSFKPAPGGGMPAVVKAVGKPKAMNFTGVDGTAYVYEGKTDFTTSVSGAPGQILNLTIGYQSCNEQMCLPPKQKVITIKLP